MANYLRGRGLSAIGRAVTGSILVFVSRARSQIDKGCTYRRYLLSLKSRVRVPTAGHRLAAAGVGNKLNFKIPSTAGHIGLTAGKDSVAMVNSIIG